MKTEKWIRDHKPENLLITELTEVSDNRRLETSTKYLASGSTLTYTDEVYWIEILLTVCHRPLGYSQHNRIAELSTQPKQSCSYVTLDTEYLGLIGQNSKGISAPCVTRRFRAMLPGKSYLTAQKLTITPQKNSGDAGSVIFEPIPKLMEFISAKNNNYTTMSWDDTSVWGILYWRLDPMKRNMNSTVSNFVPEDLRLTRSFAEHFHHINDAGVQKKEHSP